MYECEPLNSSVRSVTRSRF